MSSQASQKRKKKRRIDDGGAGRGKWLRELGGRLVYAETLYFFATSWFASTSTFANASLPGRACASASESKNGLIVLQGPHHSAWKSIVTYAFVLRSRFRELIELMCVILEVIVERVVEGILGMAGFWVEVRIWGKCRDRYLAKADGRSGCG